MIILLKIFMIWNCLGGYDLIFFDSVMLKGKEEIVQHPTQLKEGVFKGMELLEDVLMHGGCGFIHGFFYKRQFLLDNKCQFDEQCIQREDADFNLSFLKSNPEIRYCAKTVYQYNYNPWNAIKRWRKSPDIMIEGGCRRYEKRIQDIKYIPNCDCTLQVNEKRINDIYQNAVDLYCARTMTAKRKKALADMMKSIECIESVNSKFHYRAIVKGFWICPFLTAKIRIVYLRMKFKESFFFRSASIKE